MKYSYKEIYKSYKAGKRLPSEDIPKERYFQNKILNYLRSLDGCKAWKVNQGYFSEAGLPDVHCVYKGRFYGFEVKRPWYGRLSNLQRKTIEDIKAAGAFAGAVSFVEDVKEIIEEGSK